MILMFLGIYVLMTSRLRISQHYGLRGRGARVAGVIYVALGLGYIVIIGVPLTSIAKAVGLNDGATAVLLGLLEIAFVLLVPAFLVRRYGNAYPKTPPSLNSDAGG